MTRQNTRTGIALMIAAVLALSVQDGLSRLLGGRYDVLMVVMIRYWFFAGFVLALALRRPGGIRAQTTTQPLIHLARAALLVTEVCMMVKAYTLIGLGNTHAIFASCPLIITALSGPLLGERVGWQRWTAIGIGFAGMLVMLQPGSGLFVWAALLPLASATMFGLYSLLTRLATRTEDSFTSLFWSGIFGSALMTIAGASHWQAVSGPDWGWMALYGSIAVLANWLLIRCYEEAEASAVQPFAYLQLVFVAAIGVAFFGENLQWNVVIGAAIVVAAGIVTIWNSRSNGVAA